MEDCCFCLLVIFVFKLHFFLNVQQPEIYDRIDQAALLRQEQLLKAQSLQSASLDGTTRYLANDCAFHFCPNTSQFLPPTRTCF